MNKATAILVSSVCALALPAFAQDRPFGQQEIVARDFSQVPRGPVETRPDFAWNGPHTGLPKGRQLSCPTDLLTQAYKEATTGFQAASQYVTTLEVLNLCSEHDRIFKAAVDAERDLIEAYNALLIAKGEGLPGHAAISYEVDREGRRSEVITPIIEADREDRRSKAIAPVIEVDTTTADQFLNQVAQCVTVQEGDLSVDQKLIGGVLLGADGKIAGEINLIAVGGGEGNAYQAEVSLAKQAMLLCGTTGYEIDGHDVSTPLSVEFSLNELYALKSPTLVDDPASELGCSVPRPANAYEFIGHASAAGRAPVADIALVSSFDEATSWFTQTYFVRAGEDLPDGVKLVAINIADPSDPTDVTEVTLRDCAGDLRVKVADRMVSMSAQAPRHSVTIRNRETGEMTVPPEPIIVSPRFQ